MSQRLKLLHGSASNIFRALLSSIVALVLPSLFVRHMSPAAYGAWVLILQCNSYVTILDFGLQTAVGKLIAEFDARGERTECARILSSSFAILSLSSLLGAAVATIISAHVPILFHQVPAFLTKELSQGIVIVGLGASFALPFNAFIAVFTGLQRYVYPTVVATISKIATSLFTIVLLIWASDLIYLAWCISLFNVVTSLAYYCGWRKLASERVAFSLRFVNLKSASKLAHYGGILSIWTLATLLISGMDLFIVAHFDYKNTAYYGVAANATNFLLLVLTSIFSPLLPAISSLQTQRTPAQIGQVTIRVTRYSTLAICFLGLPLLILSYPLLELWVGRNYALHTSAFLIILVLGNSIRMLFYPYTLVAVATGTQHLATFAAIAEALVNFSLSIFLVQRLGAIGVGIGTLAGAGISITVHFLVSMRHTRRVISFSRREFATKGLFRPLACTIPSAVLLLVLRRFDNHLPGPISTALWASITVSIALLLGMNREERSYCLRKLRSLG